MKNSSWYSKHPEGAPYFLEYLPLIDERNHVLGFDPSLSYERFIPAQGPNGAISEIEANYVRGLVQHAEARGQIPVLTATRSIGRLPGLKAAVPGLHVLLYRNLFQQWCSYTEQAGRVGRFFLDCTIKVVSLSQHDPAMREIAAMFPVDVPSERDRNTFYQFVFLHLYCYAHAAPAADLVLDINRVASDAAYRGEVEGAFGAQGLRIDLSDTRPSIAYSLVDFPSVAEMRDVILVTGRAIVSRAPSEIGRAFVQRAMDDLLAEHDRHDFHAKGIRSALGKAVDEGATARADADAAGREHAGLVAERDAAREAFEETARARAAAEAQHAAALAQAETMRLEYEAARAEVAAIRNERNTALTDHDNSVLARQGVEAERDAAVAERDGSRSEAEAHRLAREAADAARQAEAEARQAVEAERDASRSEAEAERGRREAAEAERAAEAAARSAAEAERDASRSEAEAQRLAREAAEAARQAEAEARQAVESERDAQRSAAEAERRLREAAEAEIRAAAAARAAAEADLRAERAAREIAETARAHVEAERRSEAQARQAERNASRANDERLRRENGAAIAERDAARAAVAAAEARHAALLRWSVAFHDSTAASLSWKLTRPLRWLRIGRPKRPGAPPV